MKVVIKGCVIEGKLKLDDENREKLALLMDDLEGKLVEMTICRQTKHRSKNQQGYYHGVIIKMLENNEPFEGWTHEEIKDYLEREYAPKIYEDGKPIRLVPEEMWTTKQQEEINERVRQDMLIKHNVIIPLPNEVVY